MIPQEVRSLLEKQQYRIVGNHSAVKICHWTKESLVSGRVCYKQKWYGIFSHRCMEFTPSVIWCTHHCLFCWRIQSGDRNLRWKEFPFPFKGDDPKEILEKAIEARKQLLSGFKGNEKVSLKKWEEAIKPTNIAISLSGEPTLYPRLGELIEESHRMGMKTFLVSNGTLPEAIEKLDPLPWQFYVTVAAPDKETYLKTCRPIIRDGWKRLNKTLEIFSSLECRRVIRLTLVKGLNLKDPEKYAKLILKAEPDFCEVKGFMHVGEAQKRLPREAMPRFSDIQEFARKLSELTGYKIKGEDLDSIVVLLSKS